MNVLYYRVSKKPLLPDFKLVRLWNVQCQRHISFVLILIKGNPLEILLNNGNVVVADSGHLFKFEWILHFCNFN